MVKHIAEDYIASSEFNDKITTAIHAAADDAIDHAVTIVMKKIARKVVFNALNSEDK